MSKKFAYCKDTEYILLNNSKVAFRSKVDRELVVSIFGMRELVAPVIISSKIGQSHTGPVLVILYRARSCRKSIVPAARQLFRSRET